MSLKSEKIGVMIDEDAINVGKVLNDLQKQRLVQNMRRKARWGSNSGMKLGTHKRWGIRKA